MGKIEVREKRILRRWSNNEDDLIREHYIELGPLKIMKLLRGRSRQSIKNRAYRLKVRFMKRKKAFCEDCGKEVGPYSRTHPILCNSCSKKRFYKKNGPPGNKERLYKPEEIEILKEEYFECDLKELSKKLNKTRSSIIHKAIMLGIKRNTIFQHTAGAKYFRENNPMYNPIFKKKSMDKIKEGYLSGMIKVSGIALKSKMGLTKKENHPNWLGGISFEPYDQNWDEEFKEKIRERDNRRCINCGMEEIFDIINGQRLCIHHIDYNKKNSILKNCVSLCNSCHCKTNYKRKFWQPKFQKILSKLYGYNYN